MPENKTPAPDKADIITPAELLGDMPKESTHADDIIEANQPTEPAQPAEPAEPEPKRKRGRPKGSRNVTTTEPAAPPKPVDRASLVRSVESVFAVTAAALSAGLGEHWQPAAEEKIMIAESGADYMISQGWGDFPPGVVLILALSMYALPRAFDQRTIDAIKKRKAKPADTKTAATIPAPAVIKEPDNAHTNNWRNGHGQNHVGRDASPPGGAYAAASVSI